MEEVQSKKAVRQAYGVVLVAVIAYIASIAIGFTTPVRSSHGRVADPDSLVLPHVRVGSLSINLSLNGELYAAVPLSQAVGFEPVFSKKTKGDCTAEGLREDFCVRFGKLDQDPSLFYAIASCRNKTRTSFLGGCRYSDEYVIDYCITTSDVDWRLCRQAETACESFNINHPTVNLEVSNASNPVVSFPVSIRSQNNNTRFALEVFGFSPVSNLYPTSIVSRVLSLNSQLSVLGTSESSTDIHFAGESVLQLAFSLNTSINISSIDVLFLGLSHRSRVSLASVRVSYCGSTLIPAVPIPPPCQQSHTILVGNGEFIDISLPNPYSQLKGTFHYYSLSVANSSSPMPLNTPNASVVLVVNFANFNTSFTYAKQAVKTPQPYSSTYDSTFGLSNPYTVYFNVENRWLNFTLDARGGPFAIILPKELTQVTHAPNLKLWLASECAFSSTVSVYVNQDITCLQKDLQFSGLFSMPYQFSPVSILPIKQNFQSLQTALSGIETNGYLRFNYKRDLILNNQLLAGPLLCIPKYFFSKDSGFVDSLYFFKVVQVNQTQWDLLTPIVMTPNTTRLRVLIASALDYIFVNGTKIKNLSAQLESLVCLQNDNSSLATSILTSITLRLYPSATRQTQLTGFVNHAVNVQEKTLQAPYPWATDTIYSSPVQIQTFSHPSCLPDVLNVSCSGLEIIDVCLVPYKCVPSPSVYYFVVSSNKNLSPANVPAFVLGKAPLNTFSTSSITLSTLLEYLNPRKLFTNYVVYNGNTQYSYATSRLALLQPSTPTQIVFSATFEDTSAFYLLSSKLSFLQQAGLLSMRTKLLPILFTSTTTPYFNFDEGQLYSSTGIYYEKITPQLNNVGDAFVVYSGSQSNSGDIPCVFVPDSPDVELLLSQCFGFILAPDGIVGHNPSFKPPDNDFSLVDF